MSADPVPRWLLVLACSAAKRRDPTPLEARQRYDGPLWRTLRTVDPSGRLARVAFLSARYGFRDAGTKIDDYDARLTDELAKRMIAGGIETRWPRPPWPSNAEISALSNSCMEPVCDVALVGGHLYLAVMHALVKGFVAAGAVEAHARVIEINGPIGCMRRDLRRWLLDEEGRSP